MINPQNQRITKVIETLEQMNLFAAEEITQMEDFLNGTADESAVEKLAFRDLSEVSDDIAGKMSALVQELMNRGRNEEALRLGKILFTVGQSTC